MDTWAQAWWSGKPMMFSRSDRGLLFELKVKLEALAGRLGAVETKQATQEALSRVHDDDAREFRKEFEGFRAESRKWRESMQDSIYSSNNALLWRVIGAMGAIFALAVTVGLALFKAGVK